MRAKLIIVILLLFHLSFFSQSYANLEEYNREKPGYKKVTEHVYFIEGDSLKEIRNDGEIYYKNKYVSFRQDLRAKDCMHIYTTKFKKIGAITKHRYCNSNIETQKKIKVGDTTKTLSDGKFEWFEVKTPGRITSGSIFNGKAHKTIIEVEPLKKTYLEYIDTELVSKSIYYYKAKVTDSDSSLFYDEKGGLLHKNIYKYDIHGNMVLCQTIEPKEKIPDLRKQIIEYKYDQHNNWIEKKVTEVNSGSLTSNGITVYSDFISIYKREIEY